jgi:hypothetical protein
MIRALGFAVTLAALAACGNDRLEQRIEDANYCEVAEDCVDVGSHCPFGCNILVNVEEADGIDRALERRRETCLYECAAPAGEIVCAQGECVYAEPLE